MAIPSRTARSGTYFITTATHNRRRLFQLDRNAALLLETLDHYRASYLLHAYVVMPDHVHLLITPRDVTLERTMQLIKGGFSHRLASKLPVWQRGFTDHRIRDNTDYSTRRNYPTKTRSKIASAKNQTDTHSLQPIQHSAWMNTSAAEAASSS
jgi:putative transposase